MTNGISGVSAISSASSASLFSPKASLPNNSVGGPKEDSVELSSTAQKYLTTPSAAASSSRDIVEQLVRDAAAGDSGALSQLTVV